VSRKKTVELEAGAVKTLVLDALDSLKSEDIRVLDVRRQASFTDYMIFASGNSRRHVNAIAEAVVEAAKSRGTTPLGVEGEDAGEWVLVDLGDVVIHVMQPDVRRFYDLEKLWSEELVDAG